MEKKILHKTIKNMRFELRLLGVPGIRFFSDAEIVKLFNESFSRIEYVGIDEHGMDVKLK